MWCGRFVLGSKRCGDLSTSVSSGKEGKASENRLPLCFVNECRPLRGASNMGDDNPSEKGKQKKPGVFTSGFLAPPAGLEPATL